MSFRLDDEKFKILLDAMPHDEVLIAEACRRALLTFHLPMKRGYTQGGVPVYLDDGFHGSGYILVDWKYAEKNHGYWLKNGYVEKWPEDEEPFVWNVDPERERLIDVMKTLREWAY